MRGGTLPLTLDARKRISNDSRNHSRRSSLVLDNSYWVVTLLAIMADASPRFCISNSWEMDNAISGEVRRNTLHGHVIF